MSEHTPRSTRPLSAPETQAFESLRLTSGHWAALAAVPLFRRDLRPIEAHDYLTLHGLRLLLRTTPGLSQEAERFWVWIADKVGSAAPEKDDPNWAEALKLLGWHLAKEQSDEVREAYLEALGRAAVHLVGTASGPQTALQVVADTRKLIEAYLEIPISAPVRDATPSAPPPVVEANPATVVVQLAEPFVMVSFDNALSAARSVSVAEVRAWLAEPENSRALLFDDHREACSEVAVVRDSALVPRSLWVVGDVHADVLTIANIVAHAERVGQAEGVPPAFVFLGDFLDRGQHDHETLLYLFGLILKHPRRVCVLAGNHDIDLQWDDMRGRFKVTIQPAEYSERLNGLLTSDAPKDREQVELAQLLIPFWQSRPKALFLPDGTLYAHAGFPHTDTHASLCTVTDLSRPQCLSDFLWARVAERPKKRPNRGNRGHEFGWNDFAEFCKLSARLGVPPVRRLVRGHDHVCDRWQYFPDYVAYPVLTINAMGRHMEGEPARADRPHPLPVMARHLPDRLPEVVQLPLDTAEVDRAFGSDRSVEAGTVPESSFDDFPGGPQVDVPPSIAKSERITDPRPGSEL